MFLYQSVFSEKLAAAIKVYALMSLWLILSIAYLGARCTFGHNFLEQGLGPYAG